MLSTSRRVTVVRYVGVNGADRDWLTEPYRFRFTVPAAGGGDSGGRQGALRRAHRNVEWLEVGAVVVPMDVPATAMTATSAVGSDVQHRYQYNYNFQYPYVLLAMAQHGGQYDGTNDAMRDAFCMLRFRRAYQGASGRGYVQLEPMQQERRVFSPAPLASLGDMRLSLLKPNGTLFNNSLDNMRMQSLAYDIANPMLLRILLDRFVDRNEFLVQDNVMMTGFTCELTADGSQLDSTQVKSLNDFVNRHQGHEVVKVGDPNEEGFVSDFYVLAPGMLDQGVGRLLLDERLLDVVRALGGGMVGAGVRVASPAHLINVSLQSVVSLRLGVAQYESAIPTNYQHQILM